MNHAVASSPYVVVLPTHVLGLVAFFMIVLVENGRIPIDNPGGTTEISMIEESRVLEYSGREYALVKGGSWMKLFLLSSIFMNVFVIPWGLGSAASLPGALLAIPVLLGKLALCGLAIVIIDTSFAKLRFHGPAAADRDGRGIPGERDCGPARVPGCGTGLPAAPEHDRRGRRLGPDPARQDDRGRAGVGPW